jgi:polar amino acid transport system ATP-binding protein
MNGATLLSVRGVHKWLGHNHVLRGVDLMVERGQVLCILGPSGSGKTTLLRCMNHLETIDAGTIELDGALIGYEKRGSRLVELSPSDIARQRQRIGMVFQQFNLFPHLTALENVMVGPTRVRRMASSQARDAAADLLGRVGLADRVAARPRQLSGGQQQRVAIARALAMDPELILFDEPTSALDPELVGEVLTTMKKLADEGMTMVVVTHEVKFAEEVADVAVIMDHGVIVESGPAAAVLRAPRHPRTAKFLGHLQLDDEVMGGENE